MGLPARKMEHVREPASRARSLVRASSKRRPSRNSDRVSDAIVQAAVVAIAVLAVAGIARVAVAVRAAEAAIDAHRLERTIRSELLESKQLEADCSALAAPSRIGAIASSTLNMRTVTAPKYICVPSGQDREAPAALSEEKLRDAHRSSGGRSVIAALLEDVVAGEAQALLVGDVGLASSR